MSHLRFDEEGLDKYDPTDSEDEYTETEKRLLQKVKSRKQEFSDDEDEVYGVGGDTDAESDDDVSDLALSDVDGQDDDDLPDIKAWGKDKRKYYSTDYVDQDYGGFQGKDAHLAELEEHEARTLQKQLAEQLDDDDFVLDFIAPTTDDDKKQTEELIKADISKLSKRQQLQLLQKEAPEFAGLVEDFQSKILIAKDYLLPVLQKLKSGSIKECRAVDFVQTQYELILNYCSNIHMYLLLKASRVNIQNHPIVKRLYQYRQLLNQLDPIYKEIIKPQIDILKEMTEEEVKNDKNIVKKRKTLNILSSLIKQPTEENISSKSANKNSKKQKFAEDDSEEHNQPGKKVRFDDVVTTKTGVIEQPSSSDSEEENNDNTGKDPADEEISKRAITYKMAKNKGLTPYRKKELRNPRVKHKLKYRKAIIRRKGAVREPRKELSRYGGEISGIKSSVSKSIKIKT